MHKLIKHIIFNVIKDSYKEISMESIEVTTTDNLHGDFSSNILLKNRNIDKDKFISSLIEYSIIDKVEYVNGFINIFLSTDKLEVINSDVNKVKLSDQYTLTRIKNIYNRLESEDYKSDTPEFSNAHYNNLLKSYNYVIEYINMFKKVNSEDINSIFKSFKTLDENIVYRKHTYDELTEIKNLFNKITLLIERISYE